MNRVSKYLFSNFLSTFASLFSTLFLIMSIVFFLQIARITSFIEINFYELLKLYLFMLPRILIFTIPISFFIALGMSLFRLSKENETIVIFTLGYERYKITTFFGTLAIITSILMLCLSLFMMPAAEDLKDNFINYKKSKAKLNIKASEFGQKFSDWLVFIQNEKNDNNTTSYSDIVLYNHPKDKNDQEKIIYAKNGKFVNKNGIFEFDLNKGVAYTIDKKNWHVTEFKNMVIRTGIDDRIKPSKSIKEYWSEMKKSDKRKKDFSIYVLVSLCPIATFLYAISFGIVTYRYEKGIIYLGIFATILSYFTLLMIFAKYPLYAIPSIFFSFLITSYIYYRIKIVRKF